MATELDVKNRNVQSRAYYRGRVTNLSNSLTNISQLTQLELSQKLSILQNIKSKIIEYNGLIQDYYLKNEPDNYQTEMVGCETYDDTLSNLITEIKLSQNNLSNVNNNSNNVHNVGNIRSYLKSPVAPLPVFNSGEYEDFNNFLNKFTKVTSKFEYTDYDLFLLLKQQVHGKGAVLLDSIDANNQTFQCAKDLLTKAFANEAQVRQCIIKQISELKLKEGEEPFQYIGKVTSLNNAVNDLNIQSCHFLEYFIWQGLNDKFKKDLVNITNNNRPNLNQMLDNFFTIS